MRTVIFVDDDQNVREGIKRALRNESYRVLVLESAQQCVETLAVTDVQVLVTDLEMPGHNGQSLIRYFQESKPNIVRIILSGKLGPQNETKLAQSHGVFLCLAKPCHSATLRGALHAAFCKWEKQKGQSKTTSNAVGSASLQDEQADLGGLVQAAVKEVERLEQSLTEHCRREAITSKT